MVSNERIGGLARKYVVEMDPDQEQVASITRFDGYVGCSVCGRCGLGCCCCSVHSCYCSIVSVAIVVEGKPVEYSSHYLHLK